MPVTLHSPGEVVASIPDLLGFTPEHSLVALWTAVPGGALIATARLDLSSAGTEVQRILTNLAVGQGRLLIAIYPSRLVDWIDSTDELRFGAIFKVLTHAGLDISDVLLVSEGRWYSLMCANPDCCPPEGRPVGTSTTVLEAQQVSDGRLATAPNRDAVTSRYSLRPELTPPAPLLIRVSNDLAGSPLRSRCRWALQLLPDLLDDGREAAVARAQFMLLLQNVDARDWLLGSLAATPDPVLVEAVVAMALAAPDHLRPRLAGAAAALLYASGDNPVGVWALLDHADEDSLAALVRASMESCLPPTALREVFAEALVEIEARMAAEVA